MYEPFSMLHHEEGDEIRLSLKGSLTYDGERKFIQKLEELMRREVFKLKIDLEKLEYISSAGLGLLLVGFELALNAGVDYVVCNPKGMVLRNLELMQFSQIIRIET